MPGFGWKMDKHQIADVVSYIRHAWGNRAPLVDADTVGEVRKDVQLADRPARDKITHYPDAPVRHGSD